MIDSLPGEAFAPLYLAWLKLTFYGSMELKLSASTISRFVDWHKINIPYCLKVLFFKFYLHRVWAQEKEDKNGINRCSKGRDVLTLVSSYEVSISYTTHNALDSVRLSLPGKFSYLSNSIAPVCEDPKVLHMCSEMHVGMLFIRLWIVLSRTTADLL